MLIYYYNDIKTTIIKTNHKEEKVNMSTEKELIITEGESAMAEIKSTVTKSKKGNLFREKYELLKQSRDGVLFIGQVDDNPVFSHQKNAENFYDVSLKVKRTNSEKETFDFLNAVISDYIVEDVDGLKGKTIVVAGELRSRYDEDKRLCVQIFAENVEIVKDTTAHRNIVYVNARLSKDPVPRKTPRRKMDITDLFLKKETPHGVNYYFPAIAWRRNAVFSGRLHADNMVSIFGRLQSRDYVKKDSPTDKRTVHEISITQIELIPTAKNEEQETDAPPNTKGKQTVTW